MKRSLCTLFTVLVAAAALHAADEGWISMFNGKDLTGWKSNEQTEGKPGAFTVEDGMIKVNTGRTHMFYVGKDGNADFKNFEFKAKMMTKPHANSGIYFHTQYQDTGWPSKGFECQVNATHSDRKKTGGLYAVADVMDNAPNKDDVWCDYYIKVEGKHVIIKIDDKVTTDWTQPDNYTPPKGMPGRVIDHGTIALQGHDPKSTTFYKEIYLKPLP